MIWSAPSPTVVIALVVLGAAYWRAIQILRDRSRTIGRWQQAAYWAGLVVTALALIGPVDVYAAEVLWVHMIQHILLADVAGPLMLVGLRTPVLVFFWPKPVLVWGARSRVLQRSWAALTWPPVALSVWVATMIAWHIPSIHSLSLQSEWIHMLQHAGFVLTGALVWWPLIDPARHRAMNGLWKAGYLFLARTLSGVLGTVLIVSPALFAEYADGAYRMGITPVFDQQLAGAIMMSVDFLIVSIGAIAFIMSTYPGDTDPSDPTAGAVTKDTPAL